MLYILYNVNLFSNKWAISRSETYKPGKILKINNKINN